MPFHQAGKDMEQRFRGSRGNLKLDLCHKLHYLGKAEFICSSCGVTNIPRERLSPAIHWEDGSYFKPSRVFGARCFVREWQTFKNREINPSWSYSCWIQNSQNHWGWKSQAPALLSFWISVFSHLNREFPPSPVSHEHSGWAPHLGSLTPGGDRWQEKAEIRDSFLTWGCSSSVGSVLAMPSCLGRDVVPCRSHSPAQGSKSPLAHQLQQAWISPACPELFLP